MHKHGGRHRKRRVSSEVVYLVDSNREFQNRCAGEFKEAFTGAVVLSLYAAVRVQQINAPIEALRSLIEFLIVHVREASHLEYTLQDSARLFIHDDDEKLVELEGCFKCVLGIRALTQMRTRFLETLQTRVKIVEDGHRVFSAQDTPIVEVEPQGDARHQRRFRPSKPLLTTKQAEEFFTLMLSCYAILARMFLIQFPVQVGRTLTANS